MALNLALVVPAIRVSFRCHLPCARARDLNTSSHVGTGSPQSRATSCYQVVRTLLAAEAGGLVGPACVLSTAWERTVAALTNVWRTVRERRSAHVPASCLAGGQRPLTPSHTHLPHASLFSPLSSPPPHTTSVSPPPLSPSSPRHTHTFSPPLPSLLSNSPHHHHSSPFSAPLTPSTHPCEQFLERGQV